MKSIFMGNGVNAKHESIYTDKVKKLLCSRISLFPDIIEFADFDTCTDILLDAEIILSTWGMPTLSVDEIEHYLPKLKYIFHSAGTVNYFASPFLHRGVRIFSGGEAIAVAVSQYTLGQILLCNKGFFQISSAMKRSCWKDVRPMCSFFDGNYKSKVGLLGVGRVGTRVIKLLKPFDIDISVYDPYLSDEQAASLGVKKKSLSEIFSECSVISNHMANKPEIQGILDYSLFKLMSPYAAFINTGRGAQVNEKDLLRALREEPGRIALLDVTFPEPPEDGHPFYTSPNVFLTPHIAGSTGNELELMSLFMQEDLFRILDGKKPIYEITEDMLSTIA